MRTHILPAAFAMGTALITTPLTAAPLSAVSRSVVADAGATGVQPVHSRRHGYGYGLYSPYGYSPYGYSPYGYSRYGYSPYGYSPYGYSPSFSFYVGPRYHHRHRHW